MTTNLSELLKWFYAGLTATNVAFFFSIISLKPQLNESYFLFLATVCFSISLPLLASFTIVHILFQENKVDEQTYNKVLSKKWVINITKFTVGTFSLGFLFAIGYISLFSDLVLITSSILAYKKVRLFFKEINSVKTI